VYGVIHSAEAGWGSAATVDSLLVAAVFLVALVVTERRVSQPIMPLRLFASRERVGAYLARLLYLGAMIGFFFFTTQYLQGVLGFTTLQAGLAFFPMTVVNFAVAMAIPRLSTRFGSVLPLVVGVSLALAGMTWLSQLHTTSSYWEGVALPMVLIGAGQGLALAALTSAASAGVDARDAGAASGLVNTFHQLGMALGLGILVAVSNRTGHAATSAAAALTARVASALGAGSVLLTLCLLTVCVLLVVPSVQACRAERALPATPTPAVLEPAAACS